MGDFADIAATTDIDELRRLAIEDPSPERSLAALEKFISGTEPVEVLVLSRVACQSRHQPVRARAIERLRERGNQDRARFIIQGELQETNPNEKWFGELNAEERMWAAEALTELGL